MKKLLAKIRFLIALVAFIAFNAQAQEVKEVIQPLSKKAYKGFMYDTDKDADGNIKVTYVMRGEKKDEQDNYEEYSFDNSLKFLSTKDVQVKKEPHADIEKTYYSASVGGTSSFDVLSMKLKLSKQVQQRTWNYKTSRYMIKKIVSNETIKARNDNGRVYVGYASYQSEDPNKSGVQVIAKIDSKEKNQADKFYILLFDDKLELKENPIDLTGAYSLVFCDQLPNENTVMVFAPSKGNGDANNYVYFQYDIEGNLKTKVEFKSPSNAMLLTAVFENKGNIYFSGSSTKSTENYAQVFGEYAPIYNPGFYEGGDNRYDAKWQKLANEKMDNFHLLKFTDNKLIFASTTPISEFKSKFKTSPTDKGSDPYKGKKFHVEQFYVTNDEDYLIAGQLKDRVKLGESSVTAYEDIICFQFDKLGKLKAQYGVNKMNNDKKSEIFEMMQHFYPSTDGKSVYWEVLEVKGTKGYASFMDAYNGRQSFHALFFPRIAKVDLTTSTLSPFKVLGDEKFYLRKDFPGSYDEKDKSITYFGHDEDYKKMWIGKAILQ